MLKRGGRRLTFACRRRGTRAPEATRSVAGKVSGSESRSAVAGEWAFLGIPRGHRLAFLKRHCGENREESCFLKRFSRAEALLLALGAGLRKPVAFAADAPGTIGFGRTRARHLSRVFVTACG